VKSDYLVIGAGFAGCTIAERIASQLDKKVILIEKRKHIGGNAYDYYNADGILVQEYGPHIFHTNSKIVWDYLCKFTEWNNYVHRVLAKVKGKEVYLPVSLVTMEQLYDCRFSPKQLEEYFEKHRVKIDVIRNSRDVIVSQIGEELYELFFKNYTKKQWGVFPDELDPIVTKRLPVRFNRDTRYFSDRYQGIPKHGYTKLFENMLSHKNIEIVVNNDYKKIIDNIRFNRLIFTGPIDYFFDHKFGKLPYRSLDFRFVTMDMKQYQNAAVVNYPNDYEYTRITEYKHMYFQKHPKTTICYEYPKNEGEPFYPIPKAEYLNLFERYKKEAEELERVYFVGRLAEYRYYNMDQAVEAALSASERIFRSS
jgi:UDP-galactopyranose mutase